jgi:hypothetical protein
MHNTTATWDGIGFVGPRCGRGVSRSYFLFFFVFLHFYYYSTMGAGGMPAICTSELRGMQGQDHIFHFYSWRSWTCSPKETARYSFICAFFLV